MPPVPALQLSHFSIYAQIARTIFFQPDLSSMRNFRADQRQPSAIRYRFAAQPRLHPHGSLRMMGQTCLRYSSEPFISKGGKLAWDETKHGGNVAAEPKVLYRRRKGFTYWGSGRDNPGGFLKNNIVIWWQTISVSTS